MQSKSRHGEEAPTSHRCFAVFLLMRRLGVLPARALGRSAQGSVGSTGRELVQKEVLSLLLHR